jgi:CDP-paratose synthetase
MKIIITGANGFIGKHLCRRLQVEGWNFSCITRPGSSQTFFTRNKIPTIQIECGRGSVVNLLKAEKATGIVHLASYFAAEHQEEDINRLIESNILFGTQLLNAAVESNARWFLNTGTFWQHYNGLKYDPVNLYAATKQAFEDIGRYFANANGLRFCTLKLADTYGPDDTRAKIYGLWEKIAMSGETLDMSPGDQLVDIVHVDQVVEAYIRLIKALDGGLINKENCESYYVSSNRKITLRELAKEYENNNGVRLNINWGGRSYRKREVMKPSCIGHRIEDLPEY